MAMARRHHRKHKDHDKKHHKDHDKPKPKKHPKPPPPIGLPPAPTKHETTTEQLRGKSTQTGEDAMNAAPTSMPEEATQAALYSTGPGEVVSYDYQRTPTYADEYNAQQHVDVPGQTLSGPGQGGFL